MMVEEGNQPAGGAGVPACARARVQIVIFERDVEHTFHTHTRTALAGDELHDPEKSAVNGTSFHWSRGRFPKENESLKRSSSIPREPSTT